MIIFKTRIFVVKWNFGDSSSCHREKYMIVKCLWILTIKAIQNYCCRLFLETPHSINFPSGLGAEPRVWGPKEPQDKKRLFHFVLIVLEIKHFHCDKMDLGINVLHISGSPCSVEIQTIRYISNL